MVRQFFKTGFDANCGKKLSKVFSIFNVLQMEKRKNSRSLSQSHASLNKTILNQQRHLLKFFKKIQGRQKQN